MTRSDLRTARRKERERRKAEAKQATRSSAGLLIPLAVGAFSVGIGLLLTMPLGSEQALDWPAAFRRVVDYLHWFFVGAGILVLVATLARIAAGR